MGADLLLHGDQFLSRSNPIPTPRSKMKYQIVLAVLLAVAIAEETKVAEAADQQVAATVYGHHGGFYGHGPFYGLHHRGYFGHGHGYRYGRSVAADVEGQESGHGAYYGHPGFYGH